MLLIAIMLLLATASAPPPSTPDPRGLFRFDDYPPGALARGEQGTAVARLIVDPSGRVESCAIEYSTGSKDLDVTTCQILQQRTQFHSVSEGADNSPVYQVVRTPPITWSIGGPSAMRQIVGPDVELEISKAPPSKSLPFDLSVDYIVKADGSVASCEPSPRVTAPPTALIALACDPSNLPPTPALRNRAGKLVDARNTATVRFTLAK